MYSVLRIYVQYCHGSDYRLVLVVAGGCTVSWLCRTIVLSSVHLGELFWGRSAVSEMDVGAHRI